MISRAGWAWMGFCLPLLAPTAVMASDDCAGEDQALLPQDGASNSLFGWALALNGDLAAISAPRTVIDGDPHSDSVLIFRFHDDQWIEETKLVPPTGSEGTWFGGSVAVGPDVVVIGAQDDDERGECAGAAYVYRDHGGTWALEQKLLADDASELDEFGTSVAIDGDVVLVGAPNDFDHNFVGSAYLFRFDDSVWLLEKKLVVGDGDVFDQFGMAVALDGHQAIVGAPDYFNFSPGSAYVFQYNGFAWELEERLNPVGGAPGDSFGFSVDLQDDWAVIGAPQADDPGLTAGAAYVYRRHDGAWIQETKLLPLDGAAGDVFGKAVSISLSTIAVGAYGGETDGLSGGSAYLFRHDGASWMEEAKLTHSTAADNDWFGRSVAIEAETVLVGAPYDDDQGNASGAAFWFREVGFTDCNGNGITDACDVAEGTSQDSDGDGIPDECEGVGCLGDMDGDGQVGPLDLGYILARLDCTVGQGDPDCDASDLNADLRVDPLDAGFVLSRFGPCGELG